MQRSEVERATTGIISTVLKRTVGTDTARATATDWDSLKHIEIMFAMEDELGVEFSEDELASLDSVQKIVDAVMSKDAA